MDNAPFDMDNFRKLARNHEYTKLSEIGRVEVLKWCQGEFILEPIADSQFADLKLSTQTGIHDSLSSFDLDMDLHFDLEKTFENPDTQIFLVEHKWDQVFDNVEEMHLPFERMAMEFQISGKRVILTSHRTNSHTLIPSMIPWISMKIGGIWTAWLTVDHKQPGYEKFFDYIYRLALGTLAAMDTEAAESVLHPAPKFINQKRIKKGKPLLLSFHTLKIKKRAHIDHESKPYQGIRRLHWRRGHWRQYEGHERIWIKSHLVGNPDLGFIDKHYKI
jgi:hypothetical protein